MKWPHYCFIPILSSIRVGHYAVIASCAAFESAQCFAPHRATFQRVRFRRRLHGSTPRQNSRSAASSSCEMSQQRSMEDPALPQRECEHPHSRLWSSTLNKSPNSHVHPSIQLVIRPPSEGGTGIVAINDIPASTVVMSLRLEEVGMIDATSIIKSYKCHAKQDDAVFNMLVNMWEKDLAPVRKSGEETQEGKRLAVLAGIVAHLQLTRYKDFSPLVSSAVKEGFALDESRRLGPFLDAMPLLPQHSTKGDRHPFPTHFLFWTDDEIEILLRGTIAQTKAREVRAGVGLIVREWSKSFLKEHSETVSQTEILNAIFSAFASVLSRSFGDAAGRDLDGKGRMLVPVVDMLNHDSENPNVSWKWHVGVGDEEMIAEGKGDIAVTTLRDIRQGEELCKCYGWRPAWDIASSYGFVPQLVKERWDCSVIPLFPAILDLTPDDIPTPMDIARSDSSLDLLLETNYGPLVQAVIAAVDASVEIRSKMNVDNDPAIAFQLPITCDSERPHQLNRLEVLSLFQPPPSLTADKYPFLRRQPVVVVGTKIALEADSHNQVYHKLAVQSILPAFRAAASAIAQLRHNHRNSISSPIEASKMAIAAASIDKNTDWDIPAICLILDGIDHRIQALLQSSKDAELWLEKVTGINSSEDLYSRTYVSRDVRDAELRVLETLRNEVSTWDTKSQA